MCSYDISLHKANCSYRGFVKVPHKIPRDTAVLLASFNEITGIRNDSFLALFAVVDISLKHNHIRHIESGAFIELYYLKVVDLIGNLLWNIPIDLFNQNIHLTDIFLGSNSFLSVPELELRAHFNLTMIDLSQNNITSAHFPMALPQKCNLQMVDLSSNQIRHVGENDLQSLNSCRVLLLSLFNNKIVSVDRNSLRGLNIDELSVGENPLYPDGVMDVFRAVEICDCVNTLGMSETSLSNLTEDTFAPLNSSSLTYLALGQNGITTLPDNVFQHLRHIVKLSLIQNTLVEFSPRPFNGMVSLRDLYMTDCNIVKIKHGLETGEWQVPLTVLDLSGNDITEVPSNSFLGLNKLWFLSLESNPLRTIYPDSFNGLTNLEDIQLNNCNLQGNALEVNVFERLPNLGSLDLSESGINVLNPTTSFTGLAVLRYLNLEGNYFQVSSLWDSQHNVSLFQDMHRLNILDLSNVRISREIPAGCFASLYNLVTLRLTNMELPKLHPDLLTGLPKLESLTLDDNKIGSLPPTLLRNQSKLITLYLSSNPIAHLDSRVFEYTTNLKGLSLSRTNIQVITEQSFATIFTSLAAFEMSYVSLSCSCKNKWFRDWIKTRDTDIVLTETVCSYDSAKELSGKPFLDFEPVFMCGPNMSLYSCVALVVATLIVSFIIIYYNRWWLNHKFFLLKLCVIGYKEIIDDEVYQYDVNIIFHDSDEKWVNDHLLANIREEYPDAVLCVGDDNLPLGMYRLDAFVEVVDNSYKSVFVISNTSSEDNWFLTKLRIALQHVNHFKRDAVLLVFLEDIPEERLPYLIRLFLSVNRPYLQWHDDPRNEEYFWDHVMKCLKVTTRLDVTLPM